MTGDDRTPADGYDVFCMGRSCIDLYAHEIGVPITEVRSFDAYVGGCPTNVSVGTRRLGLRSALLTAVGEDQIGDFVLAFLRREGVETAFIPRKPGRRTSAVILTIQPPDRFPLTFYRDNCADAALTIGDVAAAPIDRARLVFLTGTGLSVDPSRTATLFAAARARAAGATVLVDLDYRPDQWPGAAAYATNVRALLHDARLAVGTEEEVAAAGGGDPETAIRALMATGLEALVVKRGARGSTVIRRDGRRTDVAPFPVEVLNVLGAGDAFASGLIYGLLDGRPLEEAARLGNAVGAIVVTRHGCANFMPTLAEVEAFLAARGAALPPARDAAGAPREVHP
ncbi:MAG TPA: 5-dehydro-2-deoxygluconokinase [Vicinamibacterales bacterium]|nr:5-dehydro-2-deoxygluconokinase [Vicinamibacterales bacterium]